MRWLLSLCCLALMACDSDDSSAERADDDAVAVDSSTGDAGPTIDSTVGEDPDVNDPDVADAEVQDAGADVQADAGDPDAAPPVAPVTEMGPYPVGYRTDSVTYESPVLGERTLRIVYWYPASATGDTNPRYGSFIARPEVYTDAPLARAPTFPTLVFSHGNQGLAEQSFFMTEFFASHGWVVVAFDHTGNTFNNSNIDGATLFQVRPQDVNAVLDHVYGLEADPLSGRLSEQVVMSGHSFGGYTTLANSGSAYNIDGIRAACEADGDCAAFDAVEPTYVAGFGNARVAAAIPITPAGAFIFGDGLAAVEVPTLVITAGRDATLPNAREGDPIWAGLARDDNRRLDFGNAGHFSFTSFCDLGVGRDDGCSEGFTPPEEVHAATNAYAMAFARLHLLADDSDIDLLDGDRALTDIVELTIPE